MANASMLGHTGLYFQPQSDALAVALAAADGAARVGHRRAELNARLAAFFALYELAEFHRVAEEVEKASALARALGAARFDQACLLYLGKVALAEDRRADAIELMSRALTVARDTSVGFHGPTICGALALALQNPAQRREMLPKGRPALAAGADRSQSPRFYPDAMAAALELVTGKPWSATPPRSKASHAPNPCPGPPSSSLGGAPSPPSAPAGGMDRSWRSWSGYTPRQPAWNSRALFGASMMRSARDCA